MSPARELPCNRRTPEPQPESWYSHTRPAANTRRRSLVTREGRQMKTGWGQEPRSPRLFWRKPSILGLRWNITINHAISFTTGYEFNPIFFLFLGTFTRVFDTLANHYRCPPKLGCRLLITLVWLLSTGIREELLFLTSLHSLGIYFGWLSGKR